jgi:hypothetical protein
MRTVTRLLQRALRSLATRDSDYYMQPYPGSPVAATTPADDETSA